MDRNGQFELLHRIPDQRDKEECAKDSGTRHEEFPHYGKGQGIPGSGIGTNKGGN